MRVLAERLKNAGKFDFCVSFPGRSLSWGETTRDGFVFTLKKGWKNAWRCFFPGVPADGDSGPADHVGGVLQWAMSQGWR